MEFVPGPVEILTDWSSSESDHGHDEDPVPSFDSIPTSKRFPLNVHGTYTNWGPREAFRELIQNWRDAIIESNNLAPKDFCVKRESTGEANGEATPPTGDTEIVYKAFRRGSDSSADCLGFVRYKGRNGSGTIEISNLRAALQTKHLCLGRTSKDHREDQAGAHGEGLKLAALTLMRSDQNHHIFARSTSFSLSFNFDSDGCLYVDAHRIKLGSARRPKKATFPTPAVNADNDVQFIIGERRQGRNELGEKVKRSTVQQKDFKSWTKVALFLTEVEGGDASIVSTPHGDLLTSADLHGNLYLKGLLLSESSQSQSASITGCPLGFGYNFASGKTNRERQSLANAEKESKAICKILSEASRIRPDLAGKVCDLLNSSEPRYAESEAYVPFWPRSIALLFKQHLLGGEFASRWVYSSDEMVQNPCLLQIIEGMGKQPFKLTDKLWSILVHHDLVHTYEKEAQRCYKNAPAVPVPDTSFATSVNRLLRACIRACPQTSAMKVEFVNAGQVHLNYYVSKTKTLIRIHKRWLEIDAAVTELGLVGDMVEAETVACAVKRLFADVLDILPRDLFYKQGIARLPESHMKQECHRAEQRLIKYQKMEVRIVDEGHRGNHGLSVEWALNCQQQYEDTEVEIQCHRVSCCSRLRDDLLIAADAQAQKMACIPEQKHRMPRRGYAARLALERSTTCRVHRTNLLQGSHRVSGLQAGQEYFFVLITSEEPNSFVGVSNTMRVTPPLFDANRSSSAPTPASDASSQLGTNIGQGSFSLGPRLETHEFLEMAIAGDRWYKAENSDNVKAVIGIVKGEKVLPGESNKRRRLN